MDLVELVNHGQTKTMGRLWLYLLRFYFRIEVEGVENIPLKGGALILPNHSGFSGVDAVLLTFIIKRETRRRARLMAHRAFFDFSKTLKQLAESFGLKKAGIENGIDMLKKDRLLILFPEGESGNFKSSLKRYHLETFHTGFLRMAIPAAAPIIPCVVIGAEETSLNLGNINLSKFLRGLRIPLPLNFVPLPAKWTIKFLAPIDTSKYSKKILKDRVMAEREAAKIQKMLQGEIQKALKSRKYVYFKKTKKIAKRIMRQAKLRGAKP